MTTSCGRDRSQSTRRGAVAITCALIIALLLSTTIATTASANAESTDPERRFGEQVLGPDRLLFDPHEVADHGLLRALAHAGLLDTYLEQSPLDVRAAILLVVDPSAGYEQTRGELIRAAARHQPALTRARTAERHLRQWVDKRKSLASNSTAIKVAEADRRVRHASTHVHGPALQAARDSTAEVHELIQHLHSYRRAETLAGVNIQAVVFDAYLLGQEATAGRDGCDVRWTTFAAIGFNESRHGTLHNATVNEWGDPSRTLLGPLLDGGASQQTEGTTEEPAGNGFAVVGDSDNGVFDGNTQWDRAIGPMQFLPSTWRVWSADGNGDGWDNPQNMYDAVAGAANLLCGLIEERGHDPHKYLLGYNGSTAYVQKVLSDGAGFEDLYLPELLAVG